MSSKNQISTLRTSDFSINYARFGTGKKNLVILPGLSVQSVLMSADAVQAVFKDFENDFTIYLFDRRNELPPVCTVRQLAEDMVKAFQALNLDHLYIFGASQGGMMTLCIAALHPELVERICLGSASSYITDFRIFDTWINFAKNGDAEGLYLSFGKEVYPEDVFRQSEQLLKDAAKTVTEDELKRFAILAESMRNFDIRDLVPNIKCPALIIGSSDDKVLGGNSSPLIAQCMTNNPKLIMYNVYGHAVYDTAPDFREHIQKFFN